MGRASAAEVSKTRINPSPESDNTNSNSGSSRGLQGLEGRAVCTPAEHSPCPASLIPELPRSSLFPASRVAAGWSSASGT